MDIEEIKINGGDYYLATQIICDEEYEYCWSKTVGLDKFKRDAVKSMRKAIIAKERINE